MRVGGPYVLTVTYVGGASAFEPYTNENVEVNLGVTTDVNVTVKNIAVEESVTVTASERRRVQHAADRRRDDRVARHDRRTLPEREQPPRELHAPHAAGQRFVVRGPGHPDEQHHGRRLLLQQLVRPRQRAGRPHRRRADLAAGRRADPGQRRAVRRAPGQLRRRRHQHRHPQRRQHVPRLDLPPVPRRQHGRHAGRQQRRQRRHVRVRQHRRLGVRSDLEEQGVLLLQRRGREADPAGHDVPRQQRRRDRRPAVRRACWRPTSTT